MRRFLIFLLYDPDGFVDDAVLHTLRGFRPHVEFIYVVVNGYLQEASRAQLQEVVDEVHERDNVGFDVGAYRSAIGRIGYEKLGEYDELLLVNYTFLGPLSSFDELFVRMDRSLVDFWGLTDHREITPHPLLGKGTMPHHLQSYWLAFRRSLFSSQEFREYWANITNANSYNEVIAVFETELTKHFADLGFLWESAFPIEKYEVWNASMESPIALLNDGAPMVKRRIFFHDVVDMTFRGVSAREVADRAIELGLPREVLIEGIIRRTPVRALAVGLGLTLVHSAVDSTQLPSGNVGFVNGRFWKDWLRDGKKPTGKYVVVSAEAPGEGELIESHVGRYQRATREIVNNAAALVGDFEQDARLGLIVPLTEHRSTSYLGHGWQGHASNAATLAELLRLQGPLEQHSPLTPLMGVAAYRMAAFDDLPERVARAGGWDALSERWNEDALEDLFDLLAADIAKTSGFLTAEATTPEQLATSQALLAEKFAGVASRFDDEMHEPFFGKLAHPELVRRAQVGKWLRSRSPQLYKLLKRAEAPTRKTVGKLRGVARRFKRGKGQA